MRGGFVLDQTGRHEHVFTIKQPANYNGKMVWTLNTEMGVQTATASPNQLYILEERENENPNAKPPEVKIADASARVGQPIALTPAVTPAVSAGQVVVEASAAEAAAAASLSGSADYSSSPGTASAGGNGKPPKWKGRILKRFKLVDMLGQGAMGKVFRAEDVTLRRYVALKVLPTRTKQGQRDHKID